MAVKEDILGQMSHGLQAKKARKFYKGAKAVKTAYNVVKKNRSVSKPKTRKRTSSGKPSGKGTTGFGTFFRIVNKPPRKSPYNILKKNWKWM